MLPILRNKIVIAHPPPPLTPPASTYMLSLREDGLGMVDDVIVRFDTDHDAFYRHTVISAFGTIGGEQFTLGELSQTNSR